MRRSSVSLALLLSYLVTWSLACNRARAEGREGTLRATNAAGRSGAYYAPKNAADRPLPLVLAYHGTGSSGLDMVRLLRPYADKHGVIVVAPDSRRAPNGAFTWQVGDQPNDLTPDYHHTIACLKELQALPGLKVDARHMLVLGHSGGASFAPYFATNYRGFEAFAVLHGGVFAGGFGAHRPRGWFSTGRADPLRPPAAVRAALEQARAAGLSRLTYYDTPGGHELSDAEVSALLRWWSSERS